MSDRWEAIKTLFDRAADLDAAARTAVLDDPSVDPLTRAEVAALLTAHDTNTLLGEPDIGGAPERVGPFVIREKLGSGGFGSVYRAEQQSPMVREAAVKLLHPMHTGRAVLGRFSLEQHALAQLDHPSIARLFEAGITADGRPWFAMQLVRGERIDRWAVGTQAPLRTIVRLVGQAAAAAHHAHQRGIIHRDIKPSNILIEVVDGQPVARLIDFGVAKAVRADGADAGLTTERIQAGTPAYMSPEQLMGGAADVRSDVFSLGAVLFDLVSSRAVDEGDQSRLRDDLTVKAGLGEHNARFLGSLDEILRAALAPRLADRYPSAEAFAEDLAALLSGEPVSVCLPSVGERLRRSIKRSPRVWLGGAAAVVALVGVAAGATYGLLRAREERDLARLAEADAVRHRETTDAALRVAGEILTGIDPDIALGRDVTLLVERARNTLAAIDSGVLRGRPEAEALLRGVIGQALLNLGQSDEALKVMEDGRNAALAALGPQHPATRELLNGVLLCLLEQGELSRAVNEVNTAIGTARDAVGSGTPVASSQLRAAEMQVWASVFLAAGDIDAAEFWNSSATEVLREGEADDPEALTRGLAMAARIASFRGKSGQAVQGAAAVLDTLQKKHQGDHPELMRAHNNLGAYLEEDGRREEALTHKLVALRMARVLFPSNDSRTAGALNNISVTMQGLARRKEAGEALSESLAMYRAIHAGDHPDIARAMGHSAVWNAVDGRYLEAEAFARDSLAMYQRLFAGPRRDPVAHAKLTLARVVAASGRMEEAEPLFKDAVAEQRLVAKDKDDPDTARVLHIYGHALLTGGRADEAAVPLREAVEIGTRLWPNAGLPRPHLAEWAETLADALSATGRSQEADEVRGLFAQPSSR